MQKAEALLTRCKHYVPADLYDQIQDFLAAS